MKVDTPFHLIIGPGLISLWNVPLTLNTKYKTLIDFGFSSHTVIGREGSAPSAAALQKRAGSLLFLHLHLTLKGQLGP